MKSSACQGWNRLSSHNRSLVRAMAAKETGFGARGVMGLLEGKRYPRFPYPVDIPDERIYHVPSPPDELKQKMVHDFKVYPNPAGSSLTIEYHHLAKGQISLFGITGNEVLSAGVARDEDRMNLAVNGLAPGVYILRFISDTGETIHKQVIIQ